MARDLKSLYGLDFMNAEKKIRLILGKNLARVVVSLVLIIIYGSFSEYYFEHGAQGSGIKNLFDSLWFVVQTITTVGYGDTPVVTFLGKINAIAFMLVGIGILGFFTASAASSFIQYSMGRKTGEKTLKMRGHVIICNWNSLTEEITRVLMKGKTRVVLLSPLEKCPIDDLDFVNGTCLHTEDLKKVSAKDAESVIIMAEKLGDKELASAIDAKTILGIMNVRKMNPKAHIVAELFKSDSVENARLAGVDEVVVQGDISSKLLARAALYPGTIDIMKTILAANSDQQIFEDAIPASMTGKRYEELLAYLLQRGGITIALRRSGNLIINPPKNEAIGNDYMVYIAKERMKF